MAREFARWLTLWLPTSLAFGVFFYFVSSGPTNAATYESALSSGLAVFFRRFYISWVFDNAFNPQP